MGSVADKLDYLADTKEAIKNAIEAKGVEIASTATFRSYADSIDEIQGEAAYEIDTSKVDYSIGSNINAKTNNGRILQGFADIVGYHARPLDVNGDWLDVDWSKSFEICTTFKLTAYPSASAFHFIFGCGLSSTVYRFYSPSIIFYGSDYDYKMAVQIGATNSSWLVTDMVDYALSLNTWYSIRLKFNSATMAFTIDITTDFNIWTNIYSNTLSATPYHNSASLCFGGDCQDSVRSSNDLLIDTYNTYIKDDSGKIIWGTLAKSFDDGKYPIISGEYELYDYIESDGTQAIDTGFSPANGMSFKIIYSISSTSSNAWAYGAANNNNIRFGLFIENNRFSYYNNSSSSYATKTFSINTIYGDEIVFNGTITSPLAVFAIGIEDRSLVANTAMRLYSLAINNNYYLPCKRKSDGIFGLYDVANKAFLTDVLNGNPFVGGNPVGNFDIFPKYDYINDITYQCIGDYGLRSTLEVDTSNSDLINTSAVTFEACIRFDSYTQKTNNQVARFIEFGNSQLTGRLGTFGIKWRSGETIENNFVYFDDVLGSTDFHGLFEWNEGETHTVSCIKKTDGTCKLYIDGDIIFTGTSTLTISSTMIDKVTLRALYQNYQAANNTNGKVFMWRIYARELSEKEIMQNYKVDCQNYIE